MADVKMRILIVDDLATMRRIIRNTLKQLGFLNVEDAEDGQLAWNKLNQGPFNFVISDWNMPNMSGIDLVKAIRQDPALKTIPFVMLTAQAEQKHVTEAMQAGATTYLVKPFTVEALKEKIDKIF